MRFEVKRAFDSAVKYKTIRFILIATLALSGCRSSSARNESENEVIKKLREPSALEILSSGGFAVHTISPHDRFSGLASQGPFVRPKVIEALGHKDSVVRRNAAITLGMMGPEAKDAIPGLIVALKDRESHVPPAAAAAIWQIDQTAYDVKPILIAALKDADSDTRRTVAEALAHKAPEAPEANPDLRLALIEALKDGDVRINSAIALSHIKPPAEEVIPILIANYQSGESYSDVREALARIGQVAENEVTSALIMAMTTERKNTPDYQYEAQADALVKIGGAKKATPVLISALADQDPSIRFWAARVLGRLGPQAKAAVPALKKALNDPDRQVADEAAFALSEVKSRVKF